MNIHGRRSQTPISAFFDMIPMKTFTVVFILFHPFFLSYNIFYLFVFFFSFFHFTPAMQSTLGTAGASRHPRGALNGALAE